MPKRFKLALLLAGTFVGALIFIHFLQFLLGVSWSNWGVHPRSAEGVLGIFLMPLLHADWAHLISNSVPLFLLITLAYDVYPKVFFQTFSIIYILTGSLVWLSGNVNSYHIGASGIVYGLVAFLFMMGVFRKDRKSLTITAFIAFMYGGLAVGLFPVQEGISWEGHLFGALSGTLSAILFYSIDKVIVEKEEDDNRPFFEKYPEN